MSIENRKEYNGVRVITFDSSLRMAIVRELARSGWITTRSKKTVKLDSDGTVVVGKEKTNIQVVEEGLPLDAPASEDVGLSRHARFIVTVHQR